MHFGSLLIIVTLITLGAACVLFLRDVRNGAGESPLGRSVYLAAGLPLLIAVLFLFVAFLAHRFEYTYVYENSSLDLPLAYLVSAFWAGQQGSFLLWLFMLFIFGVFVMREKDGMTPVVMSVVTFTQICILVILIVHSPFARLWETFPEQFKPLDIPPDGQGMTAVLIDPWMIAHPPILFLGYASASIPFGYALAALWKNEYGEWVGRSYRWVVFSVTSLGIGIFMGGFWAYKVLGWGGFWGWDPVENSSLIPWLVGIALMHGMLFQRRKGALTKTNCALALLYFILVFYSTFLTRSGVLSDFSVHSFADYGLSTYLLVILLAFVALAFAFYAWRARDVKGKPLSAALWTWETFLVYGIIMLLLYAGIILLGTSFPLLSRLLMATPAAVNERFYNTISLPVGFLTVCLIAVAVLLMNRKRGLSPVSLALALLAIAVGIALNIFATDNPASWALTIVSLALVFSHLRDIAANRSAAILGSRIAHIGVGVFVIGVMTLAYQSTGSQLELVAGKEGRVGSLGITFVQFVEGDRSSLRFMLRRGDSRNEITTPYYMDRKMKSLYRAPHIESSLSGDLYLVPLEYRSGREAMTSLYLKKGEEKKTGDLNIRFLEFNLKGMMSATPSVGADLLVNGAKVSVTKIMQEGPVPERSVRIPGTDRTIALMQIDPQEKAIMLFVSPGRNTPVPPDSVLIDVSHKKFVWLVWLGVALVSAGCGIALCRKQG